MRVIRSAGQNVSPSDDGRLYNEAFLDGLFEDANIASLGSNVVSIGTLYGIMCGRDFSAEAQTINVELPEDGEATGYIYVEFDTTTDDVISIGSALAPFTPTYTDINTTGSVCQMVIAEYTASAVAVTAITSVYKLAETKPNATMAGSVAPFETSPATATHAVGTYLVWNYQLYKVTSSISVGETLVPGSNISPTSTGEELSALNSDLNGLVKTMVFTGTTDNTGNVRAFTGRKRILCTEVANTDYYYGVPYIRAANTWLQVYSYSSATPALRTEKSVTFTIHYLD